MASFDGTEGDVVFSRDASISNLEGVAVGSGILYISYYSEIVAVDIESNSQLWAVDDTSIDIYYSPIVYDKGVLYVAGDGGNVYSLDASDGSENWNTTTSEGGRGHDAYFGNNKLYVGQSSNVFAFNESGSEVWTHTHHLATCQAVAYNNGVVYSGGDDEKVIAADSSDGSFKWSHELHNAHVMGVAADDNYVYSASRENYDSSPDIRVIAVDKDDQTKIWEHSLGSTRNQAVSVEMGVVYSVDDSGAIHAVNPSNGNEYWSKDYSSPMVDVVAGSETVYSAGEDKIRGFSTGFSLPNTPTDLTASIQ